MSLTHTDVQLDKLTINKFKTLNDFRSAASAIGENDISIIEEPFNVDWNESDSGSPAYIKNKPVIGDGVLNIRKNGVLVGSFSANQTTSVDVDIVIPSGAAPTEALSDLTDVALSSPQDNQILKYNSMSGVWFNDNPGYIETPEPASDSGDVRYLKNTESGLSWGSLSKVAETGSYDDLSDKPEIPTQVQSDWAESDSAATSYIKNKPFIVEKLEDLSDVEISSSSTTEQTYFEDAVEDYDGNKYDAVIIGDQVWMAENLRTTHYADGTDISKGEINTTSDTIQYYYDNENSNIPLRVRGLLYNWAAATNNNQSPESNTNANRGASPFGWHLPSGTEWQQLITYLASQNIYEYNGENNKLAKSLASTTYWNNSDIDGSPGKDSNLNNATYFGLVPAGDYSYRVYQDDTIGDDGVYGTIWLSTEVSSTNAEYVYWYYNSEYATKSNTFKRGGRSIRCVCDLSASEFRAKMALRGKVLMYNGDVWTDSDIPAQTQSDWSQTTNTAPDFIKNKPVIGDGVLTVQRNGVDTGSFSANQTTDMVININVPVSASEVSALPDTTRYAADVSVSIDPSTFVMSMQLKDQLGTNIGSGSSVDLPLESVVVGGSYDSGTQMVVLTLQNGDTVEFSVADLVYGLQSEITENNKLSADLVKDGVANKVFTTAEQSKLAGIASGAEVNVQSDWAESDSGSDAYVKNKPVIGDGSLTIKRNGSTVGSFSANQTVSMEVDIAVPVSTSELTNNSYFVSDSAYTHTDNNFDDAYKGKLDSIESGAQVNVQPDWNITDSGSDAYIKNKPFIPETLSGLTDVTINLPEDGQLLKYDSLTSGWTNKDAGYIIEPPAPELTDGTIIENIVQDYDGNWYDGVVIGDQIWLASNLRTTHYADGTAIEEPNYIDYTQESDAFTKKERGLYYNTKFVISGFPFQDWHIPTIGEYSQFTNAVSRDQGNWQYGQSSYIAGSIASINGWSGVAFTPTNRTGFNAKPVGYIPRIGEIYSQNELAAFWTKTARGDEYNNYFICYIGNGYTVHLENYFSSTWMSVRCVCDLTPSEWFAANGNRYYLKYASSGAVWSLLSTVAETGSYNDLTDKPEIPAGQVQSDWAQTDSADTSFIKNKPTIGDGTLTIQRNGVDVGSFSANQTTDMVINVNVPVSASEVLALPDTTRYAADVSVSIDPSTFVMTMQLKDQLGSNIGSGSSVDLPLESVVVGGSYNSGAQTVVLTLQNGDTVEFSVADLVDGLQSEITSDNKLSADLIKDGVVNKAFTAAEQSKLSGIASGAEVNVQSDWSQSDSSADDFIKNKPTIGDGSLTVKRNGSTVGSFSANQSMSMEIDITVPVSTSELTNNSHFVSDSAYTHTDNNFTTEYLTKLETIASGAQVNVQSDWNESDSGSDAYILNKPTSRLLPDVTASDNGSILIVSAGQWTVSSVPVADNTLF